MKLTKFIQLPVVFLFAVVHISFGQNITIAGTVKDAKGSPVASATILSGDAKKKATGTDTLGIFIVTVKPGTVLNISAVGFEDTSVLIGAQSNNISIVLKQTTNTLNEEIFSSSQNPTSSSYNETALEQIIQKKLEDYLKGEQISEEVKVYSSDTLAYQAASPPLTPPYRIETIQSMGTVNMGGLIPVYHQPTETKGSRYLMSGWSHGLVVDQFDSIINNASYFYNFDKITGDLLLTQDMQNSIEIDRLQVKSFALKNSEEGYIFEHVPLINNRTYFVLLSKGTKYAAYKSIKTKMVRANGQSNGLTEVGKNYDEYVDEIVYYFIDIKNKKVEQFELKKKSIREMAGTAKDKADKYFADHKRDDIDDDFIKGIIRYLNTL